MQYGETGRVGYKTEEETFYINSCVEELKELLYTVERHIAESGSTESPGSFTDPDKKSFDEKRKSIVSSWNPADKKIFDKIRNGIKEKISIIEDI